MNIAGTYCFKGGYILIILLIAHRTQGLKSYKGTVSNAVLFSVPNGAANGTAYESVGYGRFESVRYGKLSSHKVIRVIPQSNDDVTWLRDLLQTRNDVDVWKTTSQPGREVHIHLGPDTIEDFQAHLAERSLHGDAIVMDTQEVIDKQTSCCNETVDFNSCYHTLEEIHNEMLRLEKAHPTLATVVDLGKSHEERSMLGITIKQNVTSIQGLVVITCGIHAREWISPATCMYLIHQLLNSTDNDTEIANMTKTFAWFFLPVFNVDGYDFTHKGDRLWRKNRRVFNSSFPAECVGVDLNRNFNSTKWGARKNAKDMCREEFPGHSPFSEKETSNVATYLSDRKFAMRAFFDIHSYSKLWLSPWGLKEDKPAEYNETMEPLMKVATEAIYNTSGKKYVYGPAYSTIYPTYGDSIDYVYGKLGVVHSYCLELRPGEENDNGFLVSACEINQTGGEILAALKAITPILAKERVDSVDENDKLKVKYEKEKKRRAWKRRKLRRREMKIGK